VAPAYDLEFDAFHRRAGVRFPAVLKLDAPAGRSRIQLTWREDLQINGAAEPALFRLLTPKGARVVDLARGAPVPSLELPPDVGAQERPPR
jgi:hypothetical protein